MVNADLSSMSFLTPSCRARGLLRAQTVRDQLLAPQKTSEAACRAMQLAARAETLRPQQMQAAKIGGLQWRDMPSTENSVAAC